VASLCTATGASARPGHYVYFTLGRVKSVETADSKWGAQHEEEWIDQSQVSESNPIVIVEFTSTDGHTDLAGTELAFEMCKLSKPGMICKAAWDAEQIRKQALQSKAAALKQQEKAATAAAAKIEAANSPDDTISVGDASTIVV
jgi:hypothetical protein